MRERKAESLELRKVRALESIAESLSKTVAMQEKLMQPMRVTLGDDVTPEEVQAMLAQPSHILPFPPPPRIDPSAFRDTFKDGPEPMNENDV